MHVKHALTIGLSLAVSAALAGFAQPEKQQPPIDHPAVGHPSVPLPNENWPKPRAEDVASVDAIIAAFYAIPAGEAGQARDWDRYRSLFLPDARMIPVRPRADGGTSVLYVPISDYVEQNRKYFEKGGFMDREAARRTEAFGSLVSVWSTYESRRSKDAAQPYARGINNIQLLKDGNRWWIVNVCWDFERPDAPIPEKYLTSVKN